MAEEIRCQLMSMDLLEKPKLNAQSVCGFHLFAPLEQAIIQNHWSPTQIQAFKSYQKDLFGGKIVNHSEHRAAWHTAFRNPAPTSVVQQSLDQVRIFSDRIRADKTITDVVNIGIGGSDLGPQLICSTFADQIDGPRVHFISNLDTTQINTLLKKLSAKNTLFIVTSKSFCTAETIENMHVAIAWLKAHQVSLLERVVAVTSNMTIPSEKYHLSHLFYLPEWVGGRFSIWSAVGLICAIAFGFEKFYQLHQGAYAMDQHFLSAEISQNIPVQYATQLFYALTKKNVSALGILPYAQRLATLPAYLQQLMMESLGKRVDVDGKTVNQMTGPIVFGGVGTNAQHSFQQLMMQGTHRLAVDFILPLQQPKGDARSQAMVIANCLAQVKTLRDGHDHLNARQSIPGNQYANLLILERLDLKTVGALLAFYEHAVVTMAYLFDINPFDQWGVEYAKQQSSVYYSEHGEQLLRMDCLEEILG